MSTVSLDAKSISTGALPLIDIAGLWSPDRKDWESVGQALREACLNKGFFYLKGHGVSADLRAKVFNEAQSFFDLSIHQKKKIDLSHSNCFRGYEPMRAQTLEPGQPPDLKEGFYAGRELTPDDPRVEAGKFNHGPNQWPEELPDFQPVMVEYYNTMRDLGRLLMRGIAVSLGVNEKSFLAFCSEELATLRLLHYPPQPANPEPGEKGCGAHTDFGTLTFLMQDDCGGLQVWDEDIGWIHATPVPDTYVVNLGDMMARWTNGRYRSTLHRVVNVSGKERYSVPFFYLGNPDFEINCIPTCLEEGGSPQYPPATVEQHYQEMYEATYSAADASI